MAGAEKPLEPEGSKQEGLGWAEGAGGAWLKQEREAAPVYTSSQPSLPLTSTLGSESSSSLTICVNVPFKTMIKHCKDTIIKSTMECWWSHIIL